VDVPARRGAGGTHFETERLSRGSHVHATKGLAGPAASSLAVGGSGPTGSRVSTGEFSSSMTQASEVPRVSMV
jgi:hypothetical protein